MRVPFGPRIVAVLILALQAAAAGAEPKIGVASAARNQVQGLLAGGARPLAAGSDVFANETVRTGDDSLAQLLFLDETTLSVGARSEVKLDRFVYNPDRKSGNVVLEASRGAFRFVSGSQNPTNYTIKTPLATIGVRGTIVDGYIKGAFQGQGNVPVYTVSSIQIIVWEGHAFVTAFGTTIDLGPGQALFISAGGQIVPVLWDGTAFENLFNVNFPLYGKQWELDPGFIPQPDNPLDLVDQLNTKILQGLQPPPPPSNIGRPGRGGG